MRVEPSVELLRTLYHIFRAQQHTPCEEFQRRSSSNRWRHTQRKQWRWTDLVEIASSMGASLCVCLLPVVLKTNSVKLSEGVRYAGGYAVTYSRRTPTSSTHSSDLLAAFDVRSLHVLVNALYCSRVPYQVRVKHTNTEYHSRIRGQHCPLRHTPTEAKVVPVRDAV